MAVSKSERRVFMWKLLPRAIPSNSDKAVTLEEILLLLEQKRAAKLARVYLSKGSQILEEDEEGVVLDPKQQLYVADVKRSQRYNCVTLLINRGDPDAVSPAFLDPEANDVRVEHPKEKEAPGWSAHLTISLASDGHGRHRACFEKMPRVSSSLVMASLNKIIASAAKDQGTYVFTYSFKADGKIAYEDREYRPVLSLHRIPSEKLSEDLIEGSLTGVTLTRRKTFYDGVGVGHIIKKQQEKIVITTKPAEKQTVSTFIENITSKARDEGFEDIQFHLGDLPGGATQNPTMSLDEADAMEVLYSRAQRITDFGAMLDGCYAKVCPEIESKLIELLHSEEFSRLA